MQHTLTYKSAFGWTKRYPLTSSSSSVRNVNATPYLRPPRLRFHSRSEPIDQKKHYVHRVGSSEKIGDYKGGVRFPSSQTEFFVKGFTRKQNLWWNTVGLSSFPQLEGDFPAFSSPSLPPNFFEEKLEKLENLSHKEYRHQLQEIQQMMEYGNIPMDSLSPTFQKILENSALKSTKPKAKPKNPKSKPKTQPGAPKIPTTADSLEDLQKFPLTAPKGKGKSTHPSQNRKKTVTHPFQPLYSALREPFGKNAHILDFKNTYLNTRLTSVEKLLEVVEDVRKNFTSPKLPLFFAKAVRIATDLNYNNYNFIKELYDLSKDSEVMQSATYEYFLQGLLQAAVEEKFDQVRPVLREMKLRNSRPTRSALSSIFEVLKTTGNEKDVMEIVNLVAPTSFDMPVLATNTIHTFLGLTRRNQRISEKSIDFLVSSLMETENPPNVNTYKAALQVCSKLEFFSIMLKIVTFFEEKKLPIDPDVFGHFVVALGSSGKIKKMKKVVLFMEKKFGLTDRTLDRMSPGFLLTGLIEGRKISRTMARLSTAIKSNPSSKRFVSSF